MFTYSPAADIIDEIFPDVMSPETTTLECILETNKKHYFPCSLKIHRRISPLLSAAGISAFPIIKTQLVCGVCVCLFVCSSGVINPVSSCLCSPENYSLVNITEKSTLTDFL